MNRQWSGRFLRLAFRHIRDRLLEIAVLDLPTGLPIEDLWPACGFNLSALNNTAAFAAILVYHIKLELL